MAAVEDDGLISDSPGKPVIDGAGLCLSGGGYRAMIFHTGVLWRLYDAGVLQNIRRISSVSGGSLTAGVLALNWRRLSFNPASIQTDFVPLVVTPLRALADQTIDKKAVILGLLFPGRISDRVVEAYDKFLFKGATLQELPDEPRFVINATNVQSGAIWRFSKPYMRDYRVGEIKSPTLSLAKAVAASSAFPPVLSPFVMEVKEEDFTPGSGESLQRKPFTERVVLTDGGVYDNLGLQPVEGRYRTVLVSDGGRSLEPEETPKEDWVRHAFRVLELIDNQVRARRLVHLMESYKKGTRAGAYWSIQTDIEDYHTPDALRCPHERTLELAKTPTRLARLDHAVQERLINWGYAVCDAALRRYVDTQLQKPSDFPYPNTGV